MRGDVRRRRATAHPPRRSSSTDSAEVHASSRRATGAAAGRRSSVVDAVERTSMSGCGTWAARTTRERAAPPVADRHRGAHATTSSRPSFGCDRGATSQVPRCWAFIAATSSPRHHEPCHRPRRPTRWATNQRVWSPDLGPDDVDGHDRTSPASRDASPVPPTARTGRRRAGATGGNGRSAASALGDELAELGVGRDVTMPSGADPTAPTAHPFGSSSCTSGTA